MLNRDQIRPNLLSDRRAEMLTLEPRQLMTAFSASINFQPRGSTPGGWIADTGKAYSTQGDLTFGWDKDNGQYMVNRHSSAILRYDTAAYMGIGDSAKTWEIAVPANGLYFVKIVAGDAKYTNSNYSFNAEGTIILDRTANKANHWRKGEGLVWVSDGKVTITNAPDAKNDKIDSIEVSEADPSATGKDIVNPYSLSGIVQNIHPDDGDPMPLISQLGDVKNVKLWYQVDWDALPDAAAMSRIATVKDAGYTTTVTFSSSVVPTYEQAKAFFQRVAAYPGATKNIDFWEIGNEPNHGSFWTGTQTEFIQDYMRPAYEVLKPLGEPTIGGGVTFDAAYCAQLEALGYSNYCDYAGFHPYGFSADQVIQRATDAKAAFDGKPMIVTEWNLVWDATDLAGWANQLKIAAKALQKIAYINFYYGLRVNESQTGVAGLFTADGSAKNDIFYDAIDPLFQ